ncbi:MAG: DUF6514 family protein [Clostridia bacterium]|jgi:hypothetical protein
MHDRCPEKVMFLTEDETRLKLNEPIVLEYYLIDRIIEEDDIQEKRTYGVEIVKRFGNECVEKEIIHDLTCDKEKAVELLHKFAENTVTPTGIRYVVDDLIGV